MIYAKLLINLLASASIAFASAPISGTISDMPADSPEEPVIQAEKVLSVPFYSQFSDISRPEWQKLGCGIASLAMLIEFYNPGSVSVDSLLQEGISAGAFLDGAGWKHRDLALLANKYGLQGANYDLSHLSSEAAFAKFEEILKEGPVMVSVHYTFDPRNPIPHLAVVNGIDGDIVYYNDPAEGAPNKTIPTADFLKAWKKRFIVVRK